MHDVDNFETHISSLGHNLDNPFLSLQPIPTSTLKVKYVVYSEILHGVVFRSLNLI